MSLIKDYKMLTPSEHSLWRYPMMWLSAGAIMLIPLAYACIYLSSLLDPFGNLKNLPVGFVNLDVGARVEGKTYHLGRDVVETLQAGRRFRYVSFDSEAAAREALVRQPRQPPRNPNL